MAKPILTLSAEVLSLSDDGLQAQVLYTYSDDTTFTTWIDVPPPAPKQSEAQADAALTAAIRDEVKGPRGEEATTVVTLEASA